MQKYTILTHAPLIRDLLETAASSLKYIRGKLMTRGAQSSALARTTDRVPVSTQPTTSCTTRGCRACGLRRDHTNWPSTSCIATRHID